MPKDKERLNVLLLAHHQKGPPLVAIRPGDVIVTLLGSNATKPARTLLDVVLDGVLDAGQALSRGLDSPSDLAPVHAPGLDVVGLEDGLEDVEREDVVSIDQVVESVEGIDVV